MYNVSDERKKRKITTKGQKFFCLFAKLAYVKDEKRLLTTHIYILFR